MDLTYTNANRVDQGVLAAYVFDLSFGAAENDFEITMGIDDPLLEFGSVVYIEGTEYGGMVDGIKSSTNGKTITYKGRTWHGTMNSKVIQPDSGKDYLIVSGDANEILSMLIARLGLSELFVAAEYASGISVKDYQFTRYCKGYDGIRAMLESANAKLKVVWKDRSVHLSAVPIVDYTAAPVDRDIATLKVEQNQHKVNHLICLGKRELAARKVIHLYVDQFGRISETQYYTGIDEITETYDNPNTDNLKSDGLLALGAMRISDKAEITISETEGLSYDIGDIVGATEYRSGVIVAETVTQKIVKINNGVVSTDYKTGG